MLSRSEKYRRKEIKRHLKEERTSKIYCNNILIGEFETPNLDFFGFMLNLRQRTDMKYLERNLNGLNTFGI